MKNKKINIGLVGLGNIGSYFFNSILNNKKIIALETGKEPVIKYISAKNKYKKRPVKFKNAKWINNPMDLVKKNDVDIIVELVGGAGGIAKKLIKQAIINKKNVIIILMSIELILLSVNINFIAFSSYMGELSGQIFAMLILSVAAAEAAIGLAILVVFFRNQGSIAVEKINTLKG